MYLAVSVRTHLHKFDTNLFMPFHEGIEGKDQRSPTCGRSLSSGLEYVLVEHPAARLGVTRKLLLKNDAFRLSDGKIKTRLTGSWCGCGPDPSYRDSGFCDCLFVAVLHVAIQLKSANGDYDRMGNN